MIRYDPPNNFFPKNSENNVDALIEFLQEKGKKTLKYSTKRLFLDYCRYGHVLNKVFLLHREKLSKKEVTISFSDIGLFSATNSSSGECDWSHWVYSLLDLPRPFVRGRWRVDLSLREMVKV